MNFNIKKAEKSKLPLKLLIKGGSGFGKTMGALFIAFTIGKKIIVIDLEYGKSQMKSDMGDFDILEMHEPYTPEKLVAALDHIEKEGYDVCIIDSASPLYDEILAIVEKNGGYPLGWKVAGKKENEYLLRIRKSSMNIIVTVRMETGSVISTNDKGKMQVSEGGLKMIQREKTFPYIFDAAITLDSFHQARVSRNEMGMFPQEMETESFVIDDETGKIALDWLNTGKEVPKYVPPEKQTSSNKTTSNKPDAITQKIYDFMKDKSKLEGVEKADCAKYIEKLPKQAKEKFLKLLEIVDVFDESLYNDIKKNNLEKTLQEIEKIREMGE